MLFTKLRHVFIFFWLFFSFHSSHFLNNFDHLLKYFGTVDQFFNKIPCKKGYSKIALVVQPKTTYHYYRQDNNGYWSHKTGHDPISNSDASGKLITNPETCDRNYDKKNNDEFNYEIFCGYYSVKHDSSPFLFD